MKKAKIYGGIETALGEAFELIDDIHVETGNTGYAGQFFVDGKWYCCKFGCDSLQKFIDILRDL